MNKSNFIGGQGRNGGKSWYNPASNLYTMESDAPYTNRELREQAKDLQDSIDRVEAQTTKHNARMTKMEEWRAYITGGMAMLTLIALPIMGWLVYSVLTLPQSIDQAVEESVEKGLADVEDSFRRSLSEYEKP